MVEADEKSTESREVEILPGIWLDCRLALVNRQSDWLAIADVHYGYEVHRRAAGGLFPMWGMETIEERFEALLESHRPGTVILAGDIVDGGLADREAIAWLDSVRERCDRLILVAGNHDRGPIRRELGFTETFEPGGDGFFFHHGHRSPELPDGVKVEITGHWHPSVSLADGAGLRLRLPSLVRETRPENPIERWVLPAFSPWAGGGRWRSSVPGATVRQWACGPGRVLEVDPAS